MCYLNLISLFSLVAIANGHLSIDGSKRYQRERVAAVANANDLNQHRSLQLEKEFQLQLAWWNWNLCTNAYPNASFTPTTFLVPNNTVFLAGYPTYNLDNSPDTCKSKTVTREGTINTGQQTLFFPLVNGLCFDCLDDWQTGECGITFPNETDAYRLSGGESNINAVLSNATFKATTYLTIDGENVNSVYLYDTTFYFLSACADNRTQKEYNELLDPDYKGDTCDFEPYQTIGGLDIGPMVGYYGIDTRTWMDGESHTYEFGSLPGSLQPRCITAKYVITAKAPTTGEDKCGLFGLGFFCPIAWLKWLFGLFT